MKKQDKINAARIQNAVTGLMIPMMVIPKLYSYLKQRIAEGAVDAQLAAAAQHFVEAL